MNPVLLIRRTERDGVVYRAIAVLTGKRAVLIIELPGIYTGHGGMDIGHKFQRLCSDSVPLGINDISPIAVRAFTPDRIAQLGLVATVLVCVW